MSEVTTLKQLMLDAARYRWLREQHPTMKFFKDGKPSAVWIMLNGEDMDSSIDEELNLE